VKKLFQFVAALVLLAPLGAAQQATISRAGDSWVQAINGTLAAAKVLHVKIDSGSVRVEGGSQQGINYEIRNRAYGSSEENARRQFDNYKVSAYVRGDTAWVVADWQGGHMQRFSGDFVIHVPRDIELANIETDGGGVTATGIDGRVQTQSGGGPIRIHDIGGSVNAETGGDSIEVGSIGGDAILQTGGGRVLITSVKGKLNASTGGGDIMVISSGQSAVLEAGGGNIQVKQCGGKLRVSTGGGNIDIGDVGGPVEVETGGGSITVNSAKGLVHAETGAGRIALEGVSSAHAETGSGAIEVRFVAGGERSDSSLETTVGDIVMYLPQNLNARVRASIELANGHNIHSDFPDIRVASEGGQWGPKTITAEGALNGGGPAIKASTTTGDISIRRAN
jgi:DUF4097 and DUF4098 domain-containing protein YvlB